MQRLSRDLSRRSIVVSWCRDRSVQLTKWVRASLALQSLSQWWLDVAWARLSAMMNLFSLIRKRTDEMIVCPCTRTLLAPVITTSRNTVELTLSAIQIIGILLITPFNSRLRFRSSRSTNLISWEETLLGSTSTTRAHHWLSLQSKNSQKARSRDSSTSRPKRRHWRSKCKISFNARKHSLMTFLC